MQLLVLILPIISPGKQLNFKELSDKMQLINLNLKDFNKIDIFSPVIILVGILFYLLLAWIAFYYQIRGLKSPSTEIYFYIFYGSFFYLLGISIPSILQKLYPHILNLSLLHRTQNNSKKEVNLSQEFSWEKFLVLVVILSLILQACNIYYSGGIPLLSGYLKANAVTRLWMLSYLLFLPGINIMMAKYYKKHYYILLLVGVVLFALTGYRTTTIAILLSAFITLYYTRKFKWFYILIFIILILSSGLLVGYVAVKSIEWQQWSLNPFELFFFRAGYTLTVLGQIIPLQGYTQGSLFFYTLTGYFYSIDPRIIVGEVVMGYKHSSTSTIWGPALLDFGSSALAVQMFSIGLIVKLLHRLQKHRKGVFTALYGIILAQTLIWIETGPTDLVVWLFYIFALILIIIALFQIQVQSKKNKHNSELYFSRDDK